MYSLHNVNTLESVFRSVTFWYESGSTDPYLSRPLAPPMSRLLSDIPISLLYLRLKSRLRIQSRRLRFQSRRYHIRRYNTNELPVLIRIRILLLSRWQKRVIKFKWLCLLPYLLDVGTFTLIFTLKAVHKQPQKKRLGSESVEIILN